MMHDVFEAEWTRCSPWLEAALEYSGGTHTIGDVKDIVIDNHLVWFWPGKSAAAVTEIICHPRLRQMHFWLCGGSMDEIVNHMLPQAEDMGRQLGCTRFSTSGRPGWRRVMAPLGYRPALDVCWKDVT